MDKGGNHSDDENEHELRLAVEQYKNNSKLEIKNQGRKKELVQGKKNKSKNSNEISNNLSREIVAIATEKRRTCLKDYERLGAIPKGIYNEIKSNATSRRQHSNGEKGKCGSERNNSQSRVGRSLSRGRQQNEKSVAGKKNSGSNKNVPNGNTRKTKAEVSENSLQSFYYLVPADPPPDFSLPPGSHYVVSKPVDLSIETIGTCHPPRSEKDYKSGNHHRKRMESYVDPKTSNDVNKKERNCSNVNLAKDLISDYNSGECKVDIVAKMKTIKSDLEADIEGFKLALMESTAVLEQLETLKFSLNCKVPREKQFDDKKINMGEGFKVTESHEEDGAEVSSPAENCLVNNDDDEGGLNEVFVENSTESKELTVAPKEESPEEGTPEEETPEERTTEEETPEYSLVLRVQDLNIPSEEYSEERSQEDKINEIILNVTSVLPNISDGYLRTELHRIGDDANMVNNFIDGLLENQEYPKNHVDPEENERKRLWKDYVTDFNPKKFLFALSKDSREGAAASGGNDDDDIDLVLSFLSRRYPTKEVHDLEYDYKSSKGSLAGVCQTLDMMLAPVRLSESGFQEEKFNREFLLKVIYIDYEKEIDEYLSRIQRQKHLEKEEAKIMNAFLECLICFDSIVPSETTTCSEGHIFCSNCVETYIQTEMGKGIYGFKCALGDCEAFFDHETLKELLPASVLLKISMKQQAEEIMKAKVDGLESCSFCDFAYIPNPDDKIFKCQNLNCMAEICRLCHEKSHIPLRCDEIERPKDVKARKEVEEAMTNSLVRHCPTCNKKIVKSDGCNKITCPCGTLFCYLCQERIYDYTHFDRKCPLHSDMTELHVSRVREAGIQIANRLLREDPGLNLVYNPSQNL